MSNDVTRHRKGTKYIFGINMEANVADILINYLSSHLPDPEGSNLQFAKIVN